MFHECSFAIRSNSARPTINQLVKDGSAHQPWVGLRVLSLTQNIAKQLLDMNTVCSANVTENDRPDVQTQTNLHHSNRNDRLKEGWMSWLRSNLKPNEVYQKHNPSGFMDEETVRVVNLLRSGVYQENQGIVRFFSEK
jgi:hypothetical protein